MSGAVPDMSYPRGNPLATPTLVVGIASLAVYPLDSIRLSFALGALASVMGSVAVRRDHKLKRAVIGMVLGLIAFLTSAIPIHF